MNSRNFLAPGLTALLVGLGPIEGHGMASAAPFAQLGPAAEAGMLLKVQGEENPFSERQHRKRKALRDARRKAEAEAEEREELKAQEQAQKEAEKARKKADKAAKAPSRKAQDAKGEQAQKPKPGAKTKQDPVAPRPTKQTAETAPPLSPAEFDDIALGQPGYGGNGCPSGSVSATLSPDAKSLSLLFDSYVVEAGGDTGKQLDRKSCNVAIPVHVPQGISVAVLAIDYRGYNNVPAGARTDFNVEYFFAGVRGPAFRKTFAGPLDDEYLISNKLTAETLVWSRCGADVNLRTNSSIRVTTTTDNRQVMATVDSEDVSAAIVYQFQWKKC